MSKGGCKGDCFNCQLEDCIQDEQTDVILDQIKELTEMMEDFASVVGKGYSLSPSYRKLYSRRHYLMNQADIKRQHARYYQNHKEESNARHRAWAKAHPEAVKSIARRSADKQREFNARAKTIINRAV